MTLLQQIQIACTDPTKDITSILRLCMVLAQRLGITELKNWVKLELDGYSDVNDLPEYRVLSVRSYGDFYGPFGRAVKNAEIPLNIFGEEIEVMISSYHVKSSISEFAALLNLDETSSVRISWPASVVSLVGANVYQDLNCLQAWRLIPKSAIIGVIETVRNRVLEFALELEERAPLAGEPLNHNIQYERLAASNIFNTTINGDGINYSAASSNSSMIALGSIDNGNFAALQSFLESLGVSGRDCEELKEIIGSATGSETQGFSNPMVQAWFSKIIGLAAKGGLKIGTSVAASLIVKALEKYFQN